MNMFSTSLAQLFCAENLLFIGKFGYQYGTTKKKRVKLRQSFTLNQI